MVLLELGELLLIVELILLILTVYLVAISLREARQRSKLVEQQVHATRTFSRAEYFTTVMEALGEATSYVYATVTGTMPREEERETIDRLLEQFRRAAKSGVKLKLLLPKDPTRLHMGYRYVEAGAEVRYSPSLLVSELRYMVVDGHTTILGLPERRGIEEPTRKGHRIYSEGLSLLFKERFEKMWSSESSVSYEDYLRQAVEEAMASTPGVSEEHLATLLNVPPKEIREVMRRRER
ncbi:MAG: hypothetical protein NXY59_04020 [Aigarchaeota archaeon]|nr:hypothetical protein [Candidatus Pelearchaeum maunauluense]